MKRYCTGFAIAIAIAVVMAFGGWTAPAIAAPPTATPSPGYDARLQEQRSARTAHAPAVKPAPRRRAKRGPGR